MKNGELNKVPYAAMAELVDALVSDASGVPVEVQILLAAPK